MTEAKIEKGTEKVYRVTGIAKGGKPGFSARKPMHVYNNCVSVMYREISRKRAMSPRRSHRACHRRRLPHQIRLSCLNVQNMNGTVDLNSNMLYGIVERMSNESTECMFLSEFIPWIQTKKVSLVCVEEYLAFVRSKVGLIFSRSTVKAWRQAGERTRFVEDSDRWLGIDVVLNGKQCTLVAAYTPTQSSAAATAQRAYFFEDGNELLNMCQETVICGGDFNSHIGRTEELRMSEEEYEEEDDEIVNETVGKHRLNPPTAGKSKQFVEWLASRGLKHVDSHCTCGRRGT